MKKLPPIEKIYEAWSTIADKRIKNESNLCAPQGAAEIISSNRTKTYTVNWNNNRYSSNDNASYWHGYAGYPVIAVLILQGKLFSDQTIIARFGGIDWTALNARHKDNKSEALEEILRQMESTGTNTNPVRREALQTYTQLAELDIEIFRGLLRPPK